MTLPPLRQPTSSAMQSISFATTTSATSTWGMPSAYSPSPTRSSSPVSRIRAQAREQHRAKIESEQGGAISRRNLDSWEAVHPKALPIPSRPAPQAIHPRASISPDRHRPRATSPMWQPYTASFTAGRHAYRERQDSGSPEPSGWQSLPPLRCVFPSHASAALSLLASQSDDTHLTLVRCRNIQPSRAASPEFVQGSSGAMFSASSRSPSPSPSVSSYSTNEASGRTDTDPTDEEDSVKVEPESVKLPPLRTMFPDTAPGWYTHHSSHGSERPSSSSVHRDALPPLGPSAAISSSSAGYSAHWRPRSPVRHDGEGVLPAQVSDLRSSISHEASRPTAPAAHTRTQWRIQQGPASARARPAPLEHIPTAGSAPTAELPVMSPTALRSSTSPAFSPPTAFFSFLSFTTIPFAHAAPDVLHDSANEAAFVYLHRRLV